MGHRLCPALPDLGENKEVYNRKRNVAHGSAQATNIVTTKKELLEDKEKVFLTQSITFVVRSTNILSESRTDLTH